MTSRVVPEPYFQWTDERGVAELAAHVWGWGREGGLCRGLSSLVQPHPHPAAFCSVCSLGGVSTEREGRKLLYRVTCYPGLHGSHAVGAGDCGRGVVGGQG